MPTTAAPRLAIVGGGLQGALLALAVLDRRPDVDLLLLERAPRLGGNHTWSFHRTDVAPAWRPFADGLAEHRWADYDVVFPDHRRRVGLGYASISSPHLARRVEERFAAAPRARLRKGVDVERLDAHGVTLSGGARIEADLVVDARGALDGGSSGRGYQKFLGLEIETARPHGLERPVVMDATVAQVDGYRFLYLLPFSPTRLLVEDTVFSTSPVLDDGAWRPRVEREIARRGWRSAEIVRTERGVLPMPWTGPGPALQTRGPLRAGYRGRFFHPATGFSFPQALRLAALVARHAAAPTRLFRTHDYHRLVRREQTQTRFAHFLNRLLFTGVLPSTRWTVFARFYRLPEDVMARLYAGRLTPADRGRLLVGRPPRGFSVRHALAGRAIA